MSGSLPTRSAARLGIWLYVAACVVYAVGSLSFTIGRVQDAIYFTLSAIALFAMRREFLR